MNDLIRSIIAFVVIIAIIIGVEKFYKAQTKVSIEAADRSMEGMSGESPKVHPVMSPSELKQGDLIAYHVPGKPEVQRVAKVVAIEGDTIESDAARVIKVNGKSTASKIDHREWKIAQVLVPRGCVFVVADHPADGEDSLQLGPISFCNVTGRILKE